MTAKIRVCIDRGGTFTDCIAFVPNHIFPVDNEPKDKSGFRTILVKLLSVDPGNYKDAPREGIRRILELATGIKHPRQQAVDTSKLELIRMGTTVATNALLERKGDETVLLITKGFKDLLRIGNQARPNLFDLSIATRDFLFSTVIEVPERVTLVGYTSTASGKNVEIPDNDPSYKIGVTKEWVRVLQPLDLEYMRSELIKVRQKGIQSVAICLMHSFTFTDHELALEKLCKSLGFTQISVSFKTSAMIKIVPRGNSTTADAYLTPGIKKYLQSFFSGFDDGIGNVKVEFMQSDGGLVAVDNFNGFKAILSGPAGGVVGYAATSYEEGGKAVIGFDMGGTSTDVSRFGGDFEHVFETTTAGITIQAPQLDISTIAAGGGSCLTFSNGMFNVGPESASSHPGPVCYRKGGPLAITDANLILGRLIPECFPKIFGESEKEPLDRDATLKEFEAMAQKVNTYLASEKNSTNSEMTVDSVAFGFIKVANESMCRPIRSLTQGKGFNAADHILACFGGAGGQHAFAIARSLGITKILIHRYSSLLSAYGQALADVVTDISEAAATTFSKENLGKIQAVSKKLMKKAHDTISTQGFPEENISLELYLNMRYHGTDTAIMTRKPLLNDDWDFESVFLENYKTEFGFLLPDRDLLIDDIRVRAVGKSIATGQDVKWTTVHRELETLVRKAAPPPSMHHSIYWEITGRIQTPVYVFSNLSQGEVVNGPALIIDNTATIAVEPHSHAVITTEHIVGFIESVPKNLTSDAAELQCDPIMLSVFGHRFMSIAEQMGRTLQKTAISTNIKERLDFSCALFGADGGLVANAPHIPVHLGSMQEAVKWQINNRAEKMREGDVLCTNHPQAGGSHLPDITVITPVFENGNIVFFVASRGHHADIGGITAGSMPPNSRELFQEGAAMKSFLLVRDGVFDETGIRKILLIDPAQYEGCSGTRCIKDNISDLKAQVAANHRGIQLVGALINEYGLKTVTAYMNFIQKNAHSAVVDLLKRTAAKYGPVLHARDYMDDGSPIELTVTIDSIHGTATFDFEGTGTEIYGNTNAPQSVTFSAIIYSLRCLIDLDIPLNQGALGPIKIIIPEGTFLNPSETAAVVGGNVLTSQRLCDVVFKCFRACAASQGCCNNFTFGKNSVKDDEGFGYYETIAGGSGAGATWHGRSGVHTHMTNTRITDPEILERRYPVILHQFGLREGTGGKGEYRGGDGVVREIEFLEKVQISILSERRVFQPYGMNGGEPGALGHNSLLRKSKNDGLLRVINFGGKSSTFVHPGDRIKICTPGGGGYGSGNEKPSEISGKFVKIAGGSLSIFNETQQTN